MNERARPTRAAPEYILTIFCELYRTGAKGYTDTTGIDMFMRINWRPSNVYRFREADGYAEYYVSFGHNGDNGLLAMVSNTIIDII